MAYQALKTGYGTTGVNRLDLQVPEVYLKLQFKDPEDKVVDFPKDVRVLVDFGTASLGGTTDAGGVLKFTAGQVAGKTTEGALTIKSWFTKDSPWHTFTLAWDTPQTQYLVCNDATPPVAVLATTDLTTVPSPPGPSQRYFSLPRKWHLKQADLDAPPVIDGAEGKWNAGDSSITHANIKQLKDIGSDANPVKIVLKPTWMFSRFEFFDRWFGPSPRGGPAGAPNPKVTVPPVALEGFRTQPNPADGDPTDSNLNKTDFAYVHSNWTVKDGSNRVQCLPWILKRKLAGGDLDPFKGDKLGLRFTLPDVNRFVFSVDANTRHILLVDPEPAPGPQRIRYYRLPKVWKSAHYYTRGVQGAAPNAKFFGELSTADINAATAVGQALKFCLDDIVLTFDDGGTPKILPIALTDKVAIYHHRFTDAIADMSKEGGYKAGKTVTVNQPYPFSNVTLEAATKYGGAANTVFYLNDYPDWTRLVLAHGSMFDCFDMRTPSSALVAGARAAVRWVDTTTGAYGKAAGTQLTPRPGIVLKPAANKGALFAIQPYYWQKFLIRYGGVTPAAGAQKHNEWTADYPAEAGDIGRSDVALLRCSDVDSTTQDEVAVLLRYTRLAFDFVTDETDDDGNYVADNAGKNSPAVAQNGWIKYCVDNISARWNGYDPSIPANNAPVSILPRPAQAPKTTPPLQVQFVTLVQHNKKDWAHFELALIRPEGRSGVGHVLGSGSYRVNCVIQDSGPVNAPDLWGADKSGRGLAAAHEMGHCLGLPDDYINYSASSTNVAHLSVLGAPYVHEEEDFVDGATPTGKGLMQGNWWMRARYFWPEAEWLRLVPAWLDVDFKVRHGAEDNYYLPHIPFRGAGPHTHRPRSFQSWPVSFNLRANAGGNTLFDSVFYLLGEDRYSTVILPGKMQPAPAGRIDGILVVMVRILVDFSGLPAPYAGANDNNRRWAQQTIFNQLRTGLFAQQLCFKRTASFQVSVGARADVPAADRCLLHFMPCLYSAGFTTAANNTPGALLNPNPHIRVAFTTALGAPAWSPPPDPKTLRINVPNPIPDPAAECARDSRLIWDRCLELLGVSEASPPTAGSWLTPASYVEIVKTVTDAGTPQPIIS